MEKDNYTVHIKLTKEEYDKVKENAQKDDRTINSYLRHILKVNSII